MNSAKTAPWVDIARQHLGKREVPGAKTAPFIGRWLNTLGAWWSDDETPWCGVFAAGCLVDAGYQKPKQWYRALAYLNYGVACPTATFGCIAVFDGGPKRPGAGHVGFAVGVDERGRIMVLGGNQSDAVTIAPFDRSRLRGLRWPPGAAYPVATSLPLLASNGRPSSSNEA